MNNRGILYLLFILIAQTFKAQTMEWLCNPGIYAEIRYLGHDMFKVKSHDGKWGVLSNKGKTLFEAKYDSITAFVENRALVMSGPDNKIVYILNERGEIVRSFENHNMYATKYPYFKEGLLGYKDKSELFGYLNLQGNTSINTRFNWVAPFQNGVATVQYIDDNGTTYFGLINKSGGSAIVDNTKYKFLSSLVDNKLFAVTDSRIGNILRIMELRGSKLVGIKKVESKMFIDLSDDKSYLASQNGKHYFIDNQWRISGANYQFKTPYEIKESPLSIVESTELLSKQHVDNGVQITYKGHPILEQVFSNVEAYEKKYAIVRNRNNEVGILRLNSQAFIKLSPISEPFVFYHNPIYQKEQDFSQLPCIEVDIKSIEVSNLKCYINENGYLSYAPIVKNGESYQMFLPYFQEDSVFDHTIEKELDIAITYDGLDWMHNKFIIKSKHKEGYSVKLDDKIYFDKDKKTASFDVIIQPVDGIWHTPVHVNISNRQETTIHDGNGRITMCEKGLAGTTKTCVYTIYVTEEGCPTMKFELVKDIIFPKKEKVIVLE